MSGRQVQAICVWHKNRESTPAMRLFRDLLQASALFPMLLHGVITEEIKVG